MRGARAGGQALKEWEAAVKAAVPAERLLEWDPATGWEPLCTFLNLPVPTPFPPPTWPSPACACA